MTADAPGLPPAGDEPVVIGRVGRPHGVRGALHVRPTGLTLASLAPGERLQALRPGAPPLALELAGRAGTDARPVLTFAGVDSRERARELVGTRLAVPPERIASLADDPDTFYVRDLVGCRVLLGDRPLGAVVEVHSAPANDVLEVAGEGEPRLVPFTADAVAEVDLGARRIVVRPDLFD